MSGGYKNISQKEALIFKILIVIVNKSTTFAEASRYIQKKNIWLTFSDSTKNNNNNNNNNNRKQLNKLPSSNLFSQILPHLGLLSDHNNTDKPAYKTALSTLNI